MRLSRMEIYGFKSFGVKVGLDFSTQGITAIIGPNGCGKSNIVDALRWVLGEQSIKTLRGNTSQDIIFAGTNKLPRAPYSEVSLFFEQDAAAQHFKFSGVSEIMVTRRINADGQNEYFINKIPCRLMDIRDLFLDTGLGSTKSYSIIEQGSIGAFLMAKPNDRRQMIDEAAGILKYKQKKGESLKRLEDSRVNLVRLLDMVREWEGRLMSLKNQTDKLQHYLETKGRVDRLESLLVAMQWVEAGKKIQNLTLREQTLAQSLEALNTSVYLANNRLEVLRIEELKLQKELETLRQKESAEKLLFHRLVDEEKFLIRELSQIESWRRKEMEEVPVNQTKKNQLVAQLNSLELESQRSKEDLDRVEQYLGKLLADKKSITVEEKRLSNHLIEKKEAYNAVTIGLAKQQSMVQGLEKNLELLLSENLNTNTATAEFDHQLTKFLEQEIGVKDDIARVKEILSSLNTDLVEHDRILSAVKAEQQNKKITLDSLQAQKNTIDKQVLLANIKLEHLKDRLKGKNLFRERLSQAPTNLKTAFLGQLNDFINIENDAPLIWLKKVEPYLSLFIFRDSLNLKELQDFLAYQTIPRLQFIKLNTDLNREEKVWPSWLQWQGQPINILHDLLALEANQADISAESVMPNIVPTNSTPYYCFPCPIFTYSSPNELSLWQEELAMERIVKQNELEQESLGVHLLKEEQIFQNLKKRFRAEFSTFQDKTAAKNLAEKDKKHFEQVLAKLSEDKRAYEAMKTKRRREIEEKILARTGVETRLRADLALYQQELIQSELKKDELWQALQATEPLLGEILSNSQIQQKEIDQNQLLLANLKHETAAQSQLIKMLESNLNEVEMRLAKFQTSEKDQVQEHEKIKSQQAVTAANKVAAETNCKKVEETLRIQNAEYFKLQQAKAEAEEAAFMNKDKQNKAQSQLEIAREQIATAHEYQTNLALNLFEEKKMRPEEVLRTFDVENFDSDTEHRKLKEGKLLLAQMDDVNLGAEKEFREAKAKLDFFQAQQADLELSIASLDRSIGEIDQISRHKFKEAFEAINQKFQELFPVLFGGGEAFMSLTDDKDLLESGIDIMARPPGKKIQNINLLSGGEKAMTAIALIIAIFHYKPAPFCIFDEVDAPLDISNIARFGQVIKTLSMSSQIILITHNPNTIDVADFLYGVTMEEPGVSRLVSVNVRSTLENLAVPA